MSNLPRRDALFTRSRRRGHLAYILLEFPYLKWGPRDEDFAGGLMNGGQNAGKGENRSVSFCTHPRRQRPRPRRAGAPFGAAWKSAELCRDGKKLRPTLCKTGSKD